MSNILSYKVEFPCGYKIEMYFEKSTFSNSEAHFDEKDFRDCPLHGKRCKKC